MNRSSVWTPRHVAEKLDPEKQWGVGGVPVRAASLRTRLPPVLRHRPASRSDIRNGLMTVFQPAAYVWLESVRDWVLAVKSLHCRAEGHLALLLRWWLQLNCFAHSVPTTEDYTSVWGLHLSIRTISGLFACIRTVPQCKDFTSVFKLYLSIRTVTL